MDNAVDLLCEVAAKALIRADLNPEQIDGVITVSSTGLAVPSLDALVMERIPFRRDMRRLPVFGLGCGGGVLGLSRAATLARAEPHSHWLLLVVELCGLTFRSADRSKSKIIATALFGDGAAAAILSTEGDGCPITASGEYCWPGSLKVMGWKIEEDGFGVQFSRDIPQLVRSELRSAADRFLTGANIPLQSIDRFVLHPGGSKVLDALEDAFDIPSQGMEVARFILREFGNMSAATVLERCLAQSPSGRRLLGALGPSFTAGFTVLDAAQC